MWRIFVPISGTLWVPESCTVAPGLRSRQTPWGETFPSRQRAVLRWLMERYRPLQQGLRGTSACCIGSSRENPRSGTCGYPFSFSSSTESLAPAHNCPASGRRQRKAAWLRMGRDRLSLQAGAGALTTRAREGRRREHLRLGRGWWRRHEGDAASGGTPAAAAGEVKEGAAGEVGSPGVSPSPSIPPRGTGALLLPHHLPLPYTSHSLPC